MRSSSYCESCCAPPLCHLPCLPKSKGDADGDLKPASPSLATMVEDKPPMVQKMEESAPVVVAATGGDGVGGDDEKCYREVAVAPKSCLKNAKGNAASDPKPASLSPTAVVEDKPPVVQKMEESTPVVATGVGGDDEKCYREVLVAPKSCLKKAKGNAAGDPKLTSLSPTAVVEDKPPVVQKMEESAPAVVAATGGDGVGGDDEKCYMEVAVAPKSCLKKSNCEENSKIAMKGNVKWRDLLGKDLTQVKEFEPSEFGDSDDEEYTGTCACVIQ